MQHYWKGGYLEDFVHTSDEDICVFLNVEGILEWMRFCEIRAFSFSFTCWLDGRVVSYCSHSIFLHFV